MPPHILPAGAVAEPDAAGVGADDEGAGGGSGPELTTPVGVSTGIALALGVGAVFSVALGARAPAAGTGCAEQSTSAVNDTIATHSCTRFGLLMPHH